MTRENVFQSLLIFYVALILQCISLSQCLTRRNLGGDNWILSHNEKGVVRIYRNASVPGSMYTALLPDHGKMSPLYRDNDVKYRWMGRTDWNYSSTFSISSTEVAAREINLVCEGLDTFASIYINGKPVGVSDNMFVRSEFSVKNFLKLGINSILIYFKSSVLRAAELAKLYPYMIPPECPPKVQNGECHVNLIRKEQCSFSWDWGPSFPTSGIWKPIYLNIFNSAVLTSMSVVTQRVNGLWVIKLDTFYNTAGQSSAKGHIHVILEGLKIQWNQSVVVSSVSSRVSLNFTIPKSIDVPLWWPQGYGEQQMFNISAVFTSGSQTTSKSLRIGFRTVELIQDPVSNNTSHGLTFYFKVNGLPIFLKGSNWIPANNFQEKITHEHILFLLQSAADVGMNALRVWGGGIYESDYFYSVADQLGILIWQDLMFSVALYPGQGHFLNQVTTEVRQQIQRLRHHPSILLWAGSNENEKALRQDWFHVKDNYSRYYKDFVQLYVLVIQPIVLEEDQSRPYLVSSPTDGAQSVKEGYVAKDPGSELYGDIHFYDYMADQWDPSVFRIPRAATEYGIQAWCNAESLSGVFVEDDYDIHGTLASHRQHHANGNLEMIGEIGIHLRQNWSPDKKTEFLDFIYLSQINQAMSIRTQTEHYRRYQGALLPDGRGLTMAALYWQLNDIWQAPTWASIDFEGRWKMLHYFSKAFFSPVLVSPVFEEASRSLNVYMVVDEIPITPVRDSTTGALHFQPMTTTSEIVKSDLPLASTFKWMDKISRTLNGNLSIQVYNYGSFQKLHEWSVPYQLRSTSQPVFELGLDSLLSQSTCPSREDCLLYLQAHSWDGKLMGTSWMTLTYPRYAHLRQANISVSAVTAQAGGKCFKVDISTDAIALYVWLSASSIPGRFSDNGFVMISPKTSVYFYSRTPVTEAALIADLKVRSLVDVSTGPSSRSFHVFNLTTTLNAFILCLFKSGRLDMAQAAILSPECIV